MLVTLLLGVLLAAALAFLAYGQRSLAKELAELRAEADGFLTLDEWENEALPRVAELEGHAVASQRHVAMLGTSVRALERRICEGEAEVLDDGYGAGAAGAAHTEDQIQVMLSSVANIFGMRPREEGAAFVVPTTRVSVPQDSQVIIEEEEEDAEA